MPATCCTDKRVAVRDPATARGKVKAMRCSRAEVRCRVCIGGGCPQNSTLSLLASTRDGGTKVTGGAVVIADGFIVSEALAEQVCDAVILGEGETVPLDETVALCEGETVPLGDAVRDGVALCEGETVPLGDAVSDDVAL
jgi:hypothetical protein